MKYRQKPVVIDAIQWTGDRMELKKFFGDFNDWYLGQGFASDIVFIKTLNGIENIILNEWIIKNEIIEFYSCKPDIFEILYEKVEGD